MNALFGQLQQALGEEYGLERELPATAVARVFLARERIMNRSVQVTMLAPDFIGALDFEQFFTAAERSASLNHPGIVPPLALGAAAGVPYIITPHVPGVLLRTRLSETPAPSLEEVVSILRDLAEALEYAHGQRQVHLDITPDAILLSQKKALLCDLGIATGIAESQNADAPAASRLSGSLNYRAPEQLAPGAAVDHRADIFAWGCTAYELLTGLPAFPRDSLRQSGAPVVDDDPAPITLVRRDVPTALTRLVMRAMSLSPADRPASAANILQLLQTVDVSERALAERTLTPAYVPAVARAATGAQQAVEAPSAKPSRGWPMRQLVPIAAAVVVALGLSGWAMSRPDSGPKEAPLPDVELPAVIERSVLVLPITSVTGAPADQEIGRGIAASLARQTAALGVTVLGRLSAPEILATAKDPRRSARDAGASAVLTGTMAAVGDSVQLHLTMLSGSNGSQIWETRVTSTAPMLRQSVASMARGMATALGRNPAAFAPATPNDTITSTAHLAVLRGESQLQQMTPDAMTTAIASFRQAVAAPAPEPRSYAGLALASALAPMVGGSDGAAGAYEAASAAASTALTLDSTSADAYVANGFVLLGRGENRAAERAFKRAIALDSSSSLANGGLGLVLTRVTDYAAARLRLTRAVRLDPATPLLQAWLVQVAVAQEQFAEAEAATRRMNPADPAQRPLLVPRTEALIGAGRAAEAVTLLDAAGAARGDGELTLLLAYACASADQGDRAREIMLSLRDAAGGTLPARATIAATLAALGDVDSAVGVLAKAMGRLDPALATAGRGVRFEQLRKDPRVAPRFAALERW